MLFFNEQVFEAGHRTLERNNRMVEPSGIEPLTSTLPVSRSPS